MSFPLPIQIICILHFISQSSVSQLFCNNRIESRIEIEYENVIRPIHCIKIKL